MAKVISLDDHRPSMSGPAKCLNCKHTYFAVAPIGCVEEMECPECGTFKSVFANTVLPQDGVVYKCTCGNYHFVLTPDCPMCSHCGQNIPWEDL